MFQGQILQGGPFMNESFDLKRFISYLFIAAIAVLFALQWGPGSVGCGKGGRRGFGLGWTVPEGEPCPPSRYFLARM